MQELPVERRLGDAVDRVADDRQVDRREVDADLVHAAGLEAHREERVVAATCGRRSKCVTASRGVSRVEREAGRVVAVAADRRLDPAAPRRGRPRTSAR